MSTMNRLCTIDTMNPTQHDSPLSLAVAVLGKKAKKDKSKCMCEPKRK